MAFLDIVYSLSFYAATAVFVIGLAYRITVYTRTPAPLKIPTTPAPINKQGVVLRLFREVAFFESLFRSNKWIWLFGWIFHVALALVLLRHLRYFTDPVWGWVALIQPFGIYAGFAMVGGLAALWLRRLLVERVRYISQPSDHLMLLLLILIGISGLVMKFVSHTDIVGVKAYMLGLLVFDWQPMPHDFPFLVHLTLVMALMVIFPFSKLLHAPGVFFSPTRNQVDNPREERHLAPWARELEAE
ncbi:MAG: sulfate reduction electron transfer complex DsrMKJOP subunit DsrM [Gammaproteobacteria bacterium]